VTLEQRLPPTDRDRPSLPNSPAERELMRRFADAFQADDIDGIVALLTEDAWLTMPPTTLEYQGRLVIASFLRENTTGAAASATGWYLRARTHHPLSRPTAPTHTPRLPTPPDWRRPSDLFRQRTRRGSSRCLVKRPPSPSDLAEVPCDRPGCFRSAWA
jgi:hypothetical protein